MKVYDITRPLREGMEVYEGDEPFKIWTTYDSGGIIVSALSMSSHAGTHIDAPAHYGLGGTLDAIPMDCLCGRVAVVDSIENLDMDVPKRLLIKGALELSRESADILIKTGIRLLGTESLTIGGDDVHRILLAAGCVILENVDLTDTPSGEYTLICLPIKIAYGESAPVRAVLIYPAGAQFE